MKKIIYIQKYLKNNFALFIIFISLILSGCEDYLEVDDPLGQIPHEMIFQDEATATAAVTTLYSKLRDETLITGNLLGLNVIMGLYADELDYYGPPGTTMENFYNHTVIAGNETVRSTWNTSYNLIYLCNAILEGLDNSTAISQDLKDQLKGETLFVRSLTYFYLVNLFGDVPYTTYTDYEINKNLSRTDEQEVYTNITQDLLLARSLLIEQYPSGERIRANRFVADALLARIYLYMGNYQQADIYASEVINHTQLYLLEILENEFLKESNSAILQLKPRQNGENTNEAGIFLFEVGPPFLVGLSPYVANGFEEGDLRRQLWVKETGSEDQLWFMANKYKMRENTGTTVEYSIVFRLAEQYLIRAEARLNTGNLTGAASDLNMLRSRAGLPLVDTFVDLQAVLLQERKSELFTEQAHRWFDLKRLGRAEEFLSPLKPNWSQTHLLLPIPEAELTINPNLQPQNPGY